ncbi:MAG: MFS transporter, partial [Cyanobacteria bacterium J06648_11]
MTLSSDPAKSNQLSFRTKVAYGLGDLGPPIASNLQLFFLLPFLTVVAGLPAGVAGTILAISKVWDAINDPMIGILSDKTHTRWGRRRPWILFGAIPFGLAFFANWLVPFPGNTTALFWYYIAIAVLFNTLYTAVNLPYSALTPELTQDYDERTSLNQFRFFFSILGSLLAGVLHPLIIDRFQDNLQWGYVLVS